MNLAFLCTSASWGGLEMNVLRLALRMRDRGHAITIYAQNATPFYSKAHENNLTIQILTIKRPYVAFAAAQTLATDLKKRNIQTLIFSYAKDNYVSSWAKYFFYKDLQLIYLQQMELGIAKKGLVQTFIYHQLNAWISPLQLLAKQVLEKTYIPARKVTVIPLGMDVQQFSQHRITKEEARTRLQLPRQAVITGIIGRLDPAKGQEYLLKAIALLRKKGMEVHGLMVGEESRGDTRQYPQYLQKLAHDLSIQQLIHFRPFTDLPEIAFAALDIFVMASYGETYGMVTIEAMASGLPIIGTNTGGTPELLNFGELGELIAPKNEQELANAIEKLIADKKHRDHLGLVAQQNARNRFDFHVQCSQLEHLIQTLTRNK